jgi:hypothetical protein
MLRGSGTRASFLRGREGGRERCELARRNTTAPRFFIGFVWGSGGVCTYPRQSRTRRRSRTVRLGRRLQSLPPDHPLVSLTPPLLCLAGWWEETMKALKTRPCPSCPSQTIFSSWCLACTMPQGQSRSGRAKASRWDVRHGRHRGPQGRILSKPPNRNEKRKQQKMEVRLAPLPLLGDPLQNTEG